MLDKMTKHDKSLQLFCKTLSGKTITLDAESYFTIEDLKKQIEDKEGVLIEHQNLIWNSKPLHDKLTIETYGIANNSTIHLSLKLLG